MTSIESVINKIDELNEYTLKDTVMWKGTDKTITITLKELLRVAKLIQQNAYFEYIHVVPNSKNKIRKIETEIIIDGDNTIPNALIWLPTKKKR